MTLEKFLAFEKVRLSGQTNMWDVHRVIRLTHGFLDRYDCHDLLKNYAEYKERWQAELQEAFK
jgi:hypothetical protein